MPSVSQPRINCAKLLFVLASLFGVTSNLFSNDQAEKPQAQFAAAAHPYQVRGSERRMLDRFQRYLDRQQWSDAFDLAARILEVESQSVVAIDAQRYISLHDYCQLQLTRLPPEALAQYRGLVDAPAEAWYRQGIAGREERLLRRIVDETFCSSWGDDALYALGEIALQRGDYHQARTFWSRITPELFETEDPARLTFPDTDLSLADVRARLALVSLREGDLQRAENEIESLFVQHGDARGRLGGHNVVYSEALAGLLQQASARPTRSVQSNWPTYAGSATRANAIVSNFQQPLERIWSHSFRGASGAYPAMFPVVIGDLLIYQTASAVQALQLENGQLSFASKALGFQKSNSQSSDSARLGHTLAGNAKRVYAITTARGGAQSDPQSNSYQSELWGIDLQRGGAVVFREATEDAATVFVGAPLVVGNNVLIALQENGRTVRSGIACYDLSTRKLSWQRWICQAAPAPTGQQEKLTSQLLTSDSGIVYFCTNVGVIAALRVDDGRYLWVKSYDRSRGSQNQTSEDHVGRGPIPCIFQRGLLFVVPTDSHKLLALEAATGAVRWSRELSGASGHLLGALQRTLVLFDRRLLLLDSATGEVRGSNEELKIMGHPVIAGNTLYLPTDLAIEMMDIATGELADSNFPLPESGGANLLATNKYLIAAGPTQMTAFQPQLQSAKENQAAQLP